jgi:hypothetical protein
MPQPRNFKSLTITALLSVVSVLRSEVDPDRIAGTSFRDKLHRRRPRREIHDSRLKVNTY